MNKDKIELKAEERDLKTKLKVLRKSGRIPAVLYGHKVKNQNLSVDAREFEKVLKKAGESTIVDLDANGKKHPVLIHDVQYHFLTSEPIHVDFYQVSMTEKLKTKVSINFTGESPAVKTMGGVLVKVLNDIEVQCLAADLPHEILVDISSLVDFSSSIHLKDISISDKIQILTPLDEVIIKVQPPRTIEEEAPVVDEKAAVEAAVTASEKPKAEGEEDKESATAKEEKK